jgi:hypothetical protein
MNWLQKRPGGSFSRAFPLRSYYHQIIGFFQEKPDHGNLPFPQADSLS